MSRVAALLHELAALREAVDAEDWPLAAALLRRHDGNLRDVLAQCHDEDGAGWAELLRVQQELIVGFAARRDEAAERLRGLQRAGGAARAYRDDGGMP